VIITAYRKMSTLTNVEKIKLEKLFGMEQGYVLDFSNSSFGSFISTITKRDIGNDKYNQASGSKANRLRAFWNLESDDLVGLVTLDMLEYWRTKKLISSSWDISQTRYDDFILRFEHLFNLENVKRLLSVSNGNSQIFNRFGMAEKLRGFVSQKSFDALIDKTLYPRVYTEEES